MSLFPCRPLYRSFPELYTCSLFYLNIQPVSFDQNRRSRSAMEISISLEKCLNLSSISRYFFLVRDVGISSTIPNKYLVIEVSLSHLYKQIYIFIADIDLVFCLI